MTNTIEAEVFLTSGNLLTRLLWKLNLLRLVCRVELYEGAYTEHPKVYFIGSWEVGVPKHGVVKVKRGGKDV